MTNPNNCATCDHKRHHDGGDVMDQLFDIAGRMRNKATPSLSWSFDVTCPSCSKEIDLVDYDASRDYAIAGHIFNNRWDRLAGYAITCRHCNHDFQLTRLEY